MVVGVNAMELDGLWLAIELYAESRGPSGLISSWIAGTLRLKGDRLFFLRDSGEPRFLIRPEWIPSIHLSWFDPLDNILVRPVLTKLLNVEVPARFGYLVLRTRPRDEGTDLEALLPWATWRCGPPFVPYLN